MMEPQDAIHITVLALTLLGCTAGASDEPRERGSASDAAAIARHDLAVATFAGGCFWCVEAPFEKLDGVVAVISGYAGGEEPNPTYRQVSSGRTGHAESVQIHYDPRRISYAELLEVYWRQIDPTDAGGQFVDRGRQYRSEIFVHDDKQRQAAEESKRALARSGRFSRPIVTPITPYSTFYPAEDYHQDYYKKSTASYKRYRSGSGRDQFLDRVWGEDAESRSGPPDNEPGPQGAATRPTRPHTRPRGRTYSRPSDAEIERLLTPLQYRVTQREGTERAFNNEYWDNKRPGIYVDVVSGEPLFSSTDKYDSGTGWPSFTRPLEEDHLVRRTERGPIYTVTELRSKHGNSHLGHVFEDGPPPTGLRYCINSASLRFIPVEDLDKEGYGEYRGLFEEK